MECRLIRSGCWNRSCCSEVSQTCFIDCLRGEQYSVEKFGLNNLIDKVEVCEEMVSHQVMGLMGFTDYLK